MPNADFQNGIIVAALAGGGSNITPSGNIEITENGEYDVTGYETATVNVAGGGIQGGYTVTFKVDGNDYYIASCQQGESITEPPTPTGTGVFTAWQLNGVDVSFPYTPSADIELTAYFATVRTEMEITGENTVLFNSAYGECKKVNADMCILGVPNVNNFMSPVIIGETASATEIKDFSLSTSTGTYTYGLKTYYYTTTQNFHTANLYSVNEKAYRPTTTSVEATIQATLDHYFYND